MAARLPGESCQYSEQCAATDSKAFCRKLKCECAPGMEPSGNSCTFIEPKCALVGYVWISEMAQCMPVLPAGANGCHHSVQCSTSTNGAYCFRHKCTCSERLIAIDGMCGKHCRAGMVFSAVVGKSVKPGGKCQYSSQCQVSQIEMTCIGGVCRCSSDGVFTGDNCAEKCPLGHILDGNGICRRGRVARDDRCYDQTSIVQRCLVNSDCAGGLRCINNLCICPPSMYQSKEYTRGGRGKDMSENFAEEVRVMERCANGEVCSDGSFCLDGICVCPAGNEECAPRATVPPSSTCNSTVRCSGGSTCIANFCQCPNFQQPINGICELAPAVEVAVGSGCPTGNERCLGGSYCRFGICECPFGTVQRSDECVWERKVAVGSPCDSAHVCAEIANCIDGICQCPLGMLLQDGKCHDFASTGAGDSCANGEFCSGGSICNKSVCSCPTGTTNQNGACVVEEKSLFFSPNSYFLQIHLASAQILHDAVETPIAILKAVFAFVKLTDYFDEQLHLRGSSISWPILRTDVYPCHCPAGEIFMGDRCQMVFAEPGESCLNGETCISNYVCLNGSCLCPEGEVSWDGNCVKEDIEIKKHMSHQVQSLFTFPSETPKKPSNHSVINRITLRVSRCESNDNCTGGAYCLGHRCICPLNMMMKDGLCQVNRVADRCTTNHDCLMLNTRCHKGECICLPGYHISGDIGCIPRTATFSNSRHQQAVLPTVSKAVADLSSTITEATINQVVDSSLEVSSGERSLHSAIFTSSPLIDAGTGSGHSPSSRQTEMIVNISGGVCNETTLCLFFSVCRNGVCKCPLGTQISDNECKFIVDVRCRTTQQCPSPSHCIDGLCFCTSGTTMSQEGLCVPINKESGPGMSCMNGERCAGFSKCVRGMCTCPPERNNIVDNKCVKTFRGQPGYLRKATFAIPKSASNRQPLKDCPTTASCLLPNCFCSRSRMEIPGGLLARDVPQIVLLTFDGPVTDQTFVTYKSLFNGNYRNPNGCPIKGTFFVSSEWNNYDQTQWLISNGHEVAVNSITHENLGGETVERWRKEMVGMRDALRHFSYASATDIIGVRAPQLELGGDNQFNMMEKFGFIYDNTMSVSGGPYWPQTLAYNTAWKCSSIYCPKNAHPGIWEVPINRFIVPGAQQEFAMLREAIRHDDSPLDVAEMLELNFNRSYNHNRAPYLLTADNGFFNALPNEGAIIALKLFIEKILKNSDVYFVTITQALKWIRRPTRSLHIHSFKPWQCNVSHKNNIATCETPSSCSFTCNGETRTVRICGTCPQVYPNLGDPTGTGNSTDER
ncbi:unnamed protein product [Litomosoides sigmodontis]|uniref:EGF-like domain-containing protein n=1 Tax=Litomosoides sigmodontis TaxID=42156 RepID=A0A3P6S0L5_LITSI|nr:unnamed protein product [Litomosoides sigmodontis]